MGLEETIRKMSGACADRFDLKKRGYLKEGYHADISVFDWKHVVDNNTPETTNNRPAGIKAVFVNGRQIVKNGKADGKLRAGIII